MNGEYSFPIIVALYGSPASQKVMKEALGPLSDLSQQASEVRRHAALSVLQADDTKSVCMQELDLLKDNVSRFATAWGRTETMTVRSSEAGAPSESL